MTKPITLSKWTPTTDSLHLRRLGKLLEEMGELTNVAARCIIQGIDEVDPGTGRENRDRLQDELADVIAQCRSNIAAFRLDEAAIEARVQSKLAQMGIWDTLTDGRSTETD